jgi:tryptophan synthase alpha chain
MNRFESLFKSRKDLLSIYFTAGYPALNDTMVILKALQEAGVDFVEIGIPFSDPLADGPVIQGSGNQALKNGMNLKLLFRQLKDMRKEITMPVTLMGYINPVLKYGIEKFVADCAAVGVDGVIIPDLPFEMYIEKYKVLFESKGIANIFLIAPQTPEERVRKLDQYGSGFLYMVSSAAVTGAKSSLSPSQISYFERIRDMKLKSPRVVGFGISNKETYEGVCKYADGAIIGSAFVKLLENSSDAAMQATCENLSYRSFMIFHPALTYLARDYGLEQKVIEVDGKEPSPAYLASLIESARQDSIKVIFIQQEYDVRNARTIAKEAGIELVVIDPMKYDWVENIKELNNIFQKYLNE